MGAGQQHFLDRIRKWLGLLSQLCSSSSYDENQKSSPPQSPNSVQLMLTGVQSKSSAQFGRSGLEISEGTTLMSATQEACALVTGASSGLGIEFARELARRRYNIVLTARSTAPMELLAGELRARYGVNVDVVPTDLSVDGAAERLTSTLDAQGLHPDTLINNAGVGLHSRFVDQDVASIKAMLQLDIISLTELTHLYAQRMTDRGGGRILLVGSMAAYQPIPLMAAYAAAKAYVLSFGEALAVELAPKVGVTVLSPGLMDTGFNRTSGYTTPASLKRMELLPATVAWIGIEAMLAGKSGVIAGRLNKVMALSSRLFPRHFSARKALQMAEKQDG